MRKIPFSGHFTADLDKPNNRRRLKIFKKFCKLEGKVLDIGVSNFVSRGLGIKDNTFGDLTRQIKAPSNDYDVITCFEVINHVGNFELMLGNMYNLLKTGGILYLATPKVRLISWYHGRGNFVEYKQDKMEEWFNFYGFEILRHEVHRPYPFKFVFRGIRPPFKWFYHKFHLYELRKK